MARLMIWMLQGLALVTVLFFLCGGWFWAMHQSLLLLDAWSWIP